MGEYKCFLVQPVDVHRIWNGIEPIIQASLDTTQQKQGIKYFTSEDYKKIIEDNVVQLFVTVKDKEIKTFTRGNGLGRNESHTSNKHDKRVVIWGNTGGF